MKKTAAICFLALLLKACGGGGAAGEPKPEVMGLRLGMSRQEAHARLGELGRLEKEERKQQEVWKLAADPTYSHLIVAYNKEYTSLRFVTAVARDDGRRVRYADVLDTGRAQRAEAGSTVTYVLEVAATGAQPRFQVRLVGNDPDFLKYYSIEKLD